MFTQLIHPYVELLNYLVTKVSRGLLPLLFYTVNNIVHTGVSDTGVRVSSPNIPVSGIWFAPRDSCAISERLIVDSIRLR